MKIILRQISQQLGSLQLEVDTVLSGRATGIFGPSGSGKTSLLEIIAGLKTPASAFIQTGDHILTDTQKKFRIAPQHRRLGYVPQDLALFPHLNVRKNLSYGQHSMGQDQKSIPWEHVIEVLEIAPLLDRGIESLSGGEKQRVAFARALMSSPNLLLMDEPLANLDQALKEKIIDHLVKIRDEFSIPIIYVSHDAREIHTLCDDVIQMSQGKIIAQGPPSEIL